MSRFGDLVGGKSEDPTPAIPAEPTPLVEDVVEEVIVESSPLEEMSKRQLEKYGREHGIELDRRHSKTTLLRELKDHMDS